MYLCICVSTQWRYVSAYVRIYVEERSGPAAGNRPRRVIPYSRRGSRKLTRRRRDLHQNAWRNPTIPTNCDGPDDGVVFCESPTTATASMMLVPLPDAIKVLPLAR